MADVHAGGAKPAVRIKVYCTASTSPSNLVDPEIASGVKDLRGSISKKDDWLQLVENPDEAVIILEVMNRHFAATGEFKTEYNKSSDQVRTTQEHEYRVKVRMKAGDSETELVGTCSGEALFGGWRCATGEIAGKVEKFVRQNYEALLRPGGAPAPAANAGSSRTASRPAAAVAEAAATSGEMLTNTSIVAMVQAGLSDAIIIKKIKTSRTSFDTSTDKLIALKKSGVSEKVIAAILDPRAQ
jgi:hypothetical protein